MRGAWIKDLDNLLNREGLGRGFDVEGGRI
jgi:hypothetical protein